MPLVERRGWVGKRQRLPLAAAAVPASRRCRRRRLGPRRQRRRGIQTVRQPASRRICQIGGHELYHLITHQLVHWFGYGCRAG